VNRWLVAVAYLNLGIVYTAVGMKQEAEEVNLAVVSVR